MKKVRIDFVMISIYECTGNLEYYRIRSNIVSIVISVLL